MPWDTSKYSWAEIQTKVYFECRVCLMWREEENEKQNQIRNAKFKNCTHSWWGFCVMFSWAWVGCSIMSLRSYIRMYEMHKMPRIILCRVVDLAYTCDISFLVCLTVCSFAAHFYFEILIIIALGVFRFRHSFRVLIALLFVVENQPCQVWVLYCLPFERCTHVYCIHHCCWC